ncbi:hypothetical protein QFC21_000378 [Naganishia friedmannii]|uniref:Uncharacterized protein n=1 Tax=Naganishia friedmannii TaxID=89922 RepID=A0ACC2WET6_9TREE|nr:hypothetical protein QFC21_000378 [Naganishia friedmannii]
MKIFSTILAVAAMAVSALAQSSMSIDTPAAIVQCQPVALNWRGGTAPYFLSIIPGGQVSAAALIDFGSMSGNSLTWTANITAGTSLSHHLLLSFDRYGNQRITLKLTDSTGSTVYSSPVTILASANSACIGGAAAVSQSSVASSATSAATTTVGSTTGSSSVPSSAIAAASAASSAAGAASSPASAATSRVSSAASAATSAAAAPTKASGAQATGVKLGAVALAVLAGGAAALL